MTDFVTLTYVQINEQVTLQNQDPVNSFNAGLKPILIDLEAYGPCYGDKAEGLNHRERLNEWDSFRVCESLNSIRKMEREIRSGLSA
jgi:hypothetical protein